METFTLSRKELHRPGLVKAACAGRITTRQAAQALGLSLRQKPKGPRGCLIAVGAGRPRAGCPRPPGTRSSA